MDRPALPLGQAPVYFYEIDKDDRIVAASETWDAFAIENEGEHLVIENVRGDLLWDHITDADTADLYRDIFKSARKGKPVQFFLRCDSPATRRMLSVKVERIDGGTDLRVSTMLFRADEREPISVRSDEGPDIRACSWCEKVSLPDGGWAEVESAVRLREQEHLSVQCRLTYTVCPDCRHQIERQLELAQNQV